MYHHSKTHTLHFFIKKTIIELKKYGYDSIMILLIFYEIEMVQNGILLVLI